MESIIKRIEQEISDFKPKGGSEEIGIVRATEVRVAPASKTRTRT